MYGQNRDLPNQITDLDQWCTADKVFLHKNLGYDSINEIEPELDYTLIAVSVLLEGGDASDALRLLKKIDQVKGIADAVYYVRLAIEAAPNRALQNYLHKLRN